MKRSRFTQKRSGGLAEKRVRLPAVLSRGAIIISETKELSANKITRRQLGRLTEPGRYALSFGWLTITAEDLAVWEKFPNAAFTLVKTASAGDDAEEFRLGSFEMGDLP